MITSTRDQTAFPEAISYGGAITAITIGTILSLIFLSLLIWGIRIRQRNRIQNTASEDEESIIAYELFPRRVQQLPIPPSLAYISSIRCPLHA
jgi:hypothetical protein